MNGVSSRSSWSSAFWSWTTSYANAASCSSAAYWIQILMKCRNPYLNYQGMLFPCGQCMPCRVNRRREWTHRIMLESLVKKDNCFVTLTYEESLLPMSATGCPTLNPLHFTNWLKRLRAEIAPLRIRFYGVGEYGDQTWRPHYHVILFGYPMCSRGRTKRAARTGRSLWRDCCDHCRLVGATWNCADAKTGGDVDLGEVNIESAQYCAQYTTKKMTSRDDFRLGDRVPEFARMSLRPGIGAAMMDDVASALMKFNLEEKQADVPSSLRMGSRIMPLGRYLRRQLRKKVGMDEAAPQATLDEAQERLRPLREAAFDASASFKETVIRAADESVRQMEARQRIWKKKGSL